MPNIVAHGCSFTRYKWPCWPKFVEWFTSEKMINKGEVGSANETIARKVIESVHTDDPEHIYIMWSGPNRYEVWNKNGNIKTGGHPESDKHEYFVRHFLDEDHNMYKTLQNILLVQMYLDKKQIPYTMMVWREDIITDKFDIYKDIDWSKFVFYGERKGLWEFSEDNFSQYYLSGETHPPPIAHYYWAKDIMFRSDILCPQEELTKLKNYYG
jgi:hypothetical protein